MKRKHLFLKTNPEHVREHHHTQAINNPLSDQQKKKEEQSITRRCGGSLSGLIVTLRYSIIVVACRMTLEVMRAVPVASCECT